MRLFLLICSLFMLSACGPELMFGSVAGAGTTLAKKKTVGDSVNDIAIWSKINKKFLEKNKEIKGIVTDVSIEVSEGRVLLTGTTNSLEDRLEILKIVWTVDGVKEVINEIKIADGSKYGFKTYTKDAWITTQVKSKFLAHKEIRSLNYNVETIEQTVYIIGIAGSEEELSNVISQAESVKDVVKVVNYVRVVTPREVTPEEAKLDENKTEEKQVKKQPTKNINKTKKVTESDNFDLDNENRHEIEIGDED